MPIDGELKCGLFARFFLPMMVNVEVPVSRQLSTSSDSEPGFGILGDICLNMCYTTTGLESRFYAVLSKATFKWPSVNATPDRSPGTETAKGRD